MDNPAYQGEAHSAATSWLQQRRWVERDAACAVGKLLLACAGVYADQKYQHAIGK